METFENWIPEFLRDKQNGEFHNDDSDIIELDRYYESVLDEMDGEIAKEQDDYEEEQENENYWEEEE